MKSGQKLIIGIDPGKTGGVTIIKPLENFPYTLISCITLPETEKEIFTLLKNSIRDVKYDRDIKYDPFAFIENVHSFPGQGIASSFKFGMGYGGLRMALTALEIPFETVTPQRWQKELGIPKKNLKENKREFKLRLVAKAQQLFPKLEIWKDNKGKQLSVADSILIAEWGRRKYFSWKSWENLN